VNSLSVLLELVQALYRHFGQGRHSFIHDRLLLLLLLQDGWYGTSAIKREYLSATVYFDRDTLVLDTRKAKNVTFTVRIN
jgi:hypothetical protein